MAVDPADAKARRDEETREIKARLLSRTEDVARLVLGEPSMKSGGEMRWGKGGALVMATRGAERGKWFDHADESQHGDLLRLIQEKKCGGSFKAAVEWSRAFLGMPAPDFSRPMSDAERRMADRERQRAEARAASDRDAVAAKVEREQTAAKDKARSLWSEAEPARDDHPYIARKGMSAAGLRQSGDTLLVPMRVDGDLWNVQRIPAEDGGKKLFLAGGRVKGCHDVLGTVDPAKPVAFVEGRATGDAVHAATGMPTVVAFSVGEKARLMRDWRARNPDQVLVDAADNDHGGKRNAGLLTAERLNAEIGAVVALPPALPGTDKTDWNDFRLARGDDAVREHFAASVAPRAEEKATVSQPMDSRRLLTEAMALEGATKLGMPPERASDVARQSVAAMGDETVRHTLDSLPHRGWAMDAEGGVKAPAPPAAAPKMAGERAELVEHLALRAVRDNGTDVREAVRDAKAVVAGMDESAVKKGLEDAKAPPDPVQALVRAMQVEIAGKEGANPTLARVVEMLATKTAGQLAHAALRTRVAWAVEDTEKLTGRALPMSADLRTEMDGRSRTVPGLENEAMKGLLDATRKLHDPGLVGAIRRTASDMAKAGDGQWSGEAQDRVSVLQDRVRMQVGGVVSQTPSPGPGTQVATSEAAPPKPTPAAEAPATVAAANGRGVAGTILHDRARSGAQAATLPWHKVTHGLEDRVKAYQQNMHNGLAWRMVADATDKGEVAMKAVESFRRGQGGPLMGRIEAAGGVVAVPEMRAGGAQEALRSEFGRAMADPRFNASYNEVVAALGQYAKQREAVGVYVGKHGVAENAVAALGRLDEALGQRAAALPGAFEGKSVLDEVTAKVGTALRDAVDRAAQAVASVAAAVTRRPSAGPSPAP